MIWAYLAGVVTLPVGYAILVLLYLALQRNQGAGGCHVCTHYPMYETGEHARIVGWFMELPHNVWWSRRKWHREAWAAHWANPKRV
jgi:hypothetical protein